MRSYVENKLYAHDPEVKLFVIGPMFRYERPQKGRLRQFNQIDVEVFGVDDPALDAEIAVLLIHFLKKVGLENLELQVNSLGCNKCRPPYRESLKSFIHILCFGKDPDRFPGNNKLLLRGEHPYLTGTVFGADAGLARNRTVFFFVKYQPDRLQT